MRGCGCAAALALACCDVGSAIQKARGEGAVVDDAIPPELPADFGRGAAVSIAVFSKTQGFRHEEAIPAAQRALREISARRGWQLFETENAALFAPELLARVRVVFGNNNTGDNFTPAQEAAFRSWMLRGGGFVGVHGAGGTSYEFWDWYQDLLLGARFTAHPMLPQFQRARLVIEDRSHPATRELPERWEREDEWYSFEASPRARGVQVLVSLDESSYSPRQVGRNLSMGDHPIVWAHCLGQGRSLFSALGHKGEYYDEAPHRALLEGALAWAAGLEGECTHPIAEPAPRGAP
jgi:type 1 glutamine amidotransferase